MGRIKHFKGETIDLEMDSNKRKEAELCKNRLGDGSCFQTTGHIQVIPPPEGTKITILHWSLQTSLCRWGKVKVKSLSHVPLWDPMNCSLLGSSFHGIFQARVLEWGAIAFSRGSSWPRDWTQVSCTVGRQFTLWAIREVCRWGSRTQRNGGN